MQFDWVGGLIFIFCAVGFLALDEIGKWRDEYEEHKRDAIARLGVSKKKPRRKRD